MSPFWGSYFIMNINHNDDILSSSLGISTQRSETIYVDIKGRLQYMTVSEVIEYIHESNWVEEEQIFGYYMTGFIKSRSPYVIPPKAEA